MSNTNSDLLDEGLQAVMGKDRCQNPEDWRNKNQEGKTERKSHVEDPVDASWVPVKDATYMDKIRACVKHGILFAGVSGLLFYWQQAGLLASSAAVPSLIFCALGAGLTIGWHAR